MTTGAAPAEHRGQGTKHPCSTGCSRQVTMLFCSRIELSGFQEGSYQETLSRWSWMMEGSGADILTMWSKAVVCNHWAWSNGPGEASPSLEGAVEADPITLAYTGGSALPSIPGTEPRDIIKPWDWTAYPHLHCPIDIPGAVTPVAETESSGSWTLHPCTTISLNLAASWLLSEKSRSCHEVKL